MAAVPVTIIGTITTASPKSGGEVSPSGVEQCVISGIATISDVPPPLGIWGPTDPRPTPPIPIYPGGTPNPPGIWGPTDPRPGYWVPGAPGAPGYQPPTKPPEPIQPPVEWKPIWAGPEHGWVVVGIPQGPTATPST